MRKIVYIFTMHCPRCGHIKTTVFDPVREACPDQAFTINGSASRDFVKRYGIKGAPCILFMENEEKAGIVYKTFEPDKIIKWLKGGKYND
jgi:hypothetical protein